MIPARSRIPLIALTASVLVGLLFVAGINSRESAPAGISPAGSDARPARVRGRLVDEDRPETAHGVPARSRAQAGDAHVSGSAAPAPAMEDGFATCAIAGRITLGGAGVAAIVRVEIERDRWQAVATDESGSFECNGLRAGRRQVSVEILPLTSCTRAVTLRPHRVVRFDLDFDRGELVAGVVHGPRGEAIAGAEVALDGERGTTDSEGRFALVRRAAGTSELVVRATGFAWSSRPVPSDAHAPLAIQLEPACSVEVRLPEQLRGREVVVHVAPSEDQPTSAPWHLLSPVRCSGLDVVTFENLPEGEIEAWVLGAGTVARAEHITLSAARRESVEPREDASASSRGSPWIAAVWRSQALAARPVVP